MVERVGNLHFVASCTVSVHWVLHCQVFVGPVSSLCLLDICVGVCKPVAVPLWRNLSGAARIVLLL